MPKLCLETGELSRARVCESVRAMQGALWYAMPLCAHRRALMLSEWVPMGEGWVVPDGRGLRTAAAQPLTNRGDAF